MRVSTTWVSRVLISVLAAWAGIAAGAPVQGQHIEVELVSEVKTIAAGQPFWLAVRLSPDPAWHTYWRNPGDSGLPTRIEWTLGAGGAVGNTLWPYPQRIPLSAQVVNYGYHDEVLLMTQVTPPASCLDLRGSAERIQRETGVRPSSFCYPFGRTSEAAVAAARANYDRACTTRLRALGDRDSPHRLPRIDAYYLRRPGRLDQWGTGRLRRYLWLRACARRVGGGEG